MASSNKTAVGAWVGVGSLMVAGCSGGAATLNPPDSEGGCAQGTETCPCYPNGTCNAGLACLSDRCVRLLGDAAGVDAAVADATIDATTLDATTADGASGDDASTGGDGLVPGTDATVDTGTQGDAARETATGPDALAGSDGSACTAGAACTPGGTADPCGLFATDCSTGTPLCIRVGNEPVGHPCGGGSVCNGSASCVACVDGADCTPASTPCFQGTMACATGTCTATTTARANGTACGASAVCDVGVCTDCVSNQSCTPTQGPCVQGRTDCSSGAQQCQAIGPLPDGTACGTGMVCSAGACSACVSSSACTPANPCHTGVLGCGANATCTDTGVRADNVYCGMEELCMAGTCSPAKPWITRGEDNRTFTSGWVYSFANNGATISPLSSTTIPFAPSPGGRTGDALRVSGMEPIPATDVSVLGALGWTFTDLRAPLDVGALGSGVDLWIKSAYTGTFQIYVLDVWTDPAFPNCSMSTSPSVVDRCYNFPMASCVVSAAQTWTECSAPWTLFVRQDFGNLGAGLPLDSTQALAMQINVPPTSISSLQPVLFDFAVDDVSFLP